MIEPQILKTVKSLRQMVRFWRQKEHKVALVPTMGAFLDAPTDPLDLDALRAQLAAEEERETVAAAAAGGFRKEGVTYAPGDCCYLDPAEFEEIELLEPVAPKEEPRYKKPARKNKDGERDESAPVEYYDSTHKARSPRGSAGSGSAAAAACEGSCSAESGAAARRARARTCARSAWACSCT